MKNSLDDLNRSESFFMPKAYLNEAANVDFCED
jgi:hypothetical protein